jgi:hypothetical protein
MLAKLISLLLHAKAGAVSGVFLLGATGALVSVSAHTDNGVTTIVLTEASASPSAVTSNQTASPSPKPTESPEVNTPSTLTPAQTTACADEAKALALQIQRVSTAYATFHTDLVALNNQRDRAVLATAAKTLKVIRHAADKAIEATATATCAKADDENETDTDDATGAVQGRQTTQGQTGKNEGAHEDADDHKAPATGTTPAITAPTFTGTAEQIATQAIAAMQTAFDTAKNSPVVVTTPAAPKTKQPEAFKSPKAALHVEKPVVNSQNKGDHHD